MTRFPFSATSRLALVLMLVGFASTADAKGPAHPIATFDVPGASLTYPTGINPAGQITGYYQDATGQDHGFVRSREGLITTFDVPGSTGTVAQAINQAGQMTGYYSDDVATHGFLRQRNGTIVTFDVPPAAGRVTYATVGTAINPSGQIAGWYREAFFPAAPPVRARGFLREVDGTFTTFSPTESDFAYAYATNPADVVVGQFHAEDGPWWPFLRDHQGTVTAFWDLELAYFTAISPSGQITGYGSRTGAFLRHADGSIVVLDVAGSLYFSAYPTAINPAGQIAGYYTDVSSSNFGFLREHDGTIQTFAVPSSTNTIPTSINASGDMTGWYSDASGNVHGFVRAH